MSKYLLTALILLIFNFSEAQTTINGSFSFGGKTRTYSFYVPASYVPGQPVPMVIGLHGLSSSGADFAQYRDFRPIADTANFIVVHPDGASLLGIKYWNYENIAGTNVDDVGFIEELINVISASHSINQNRIYCAGMSNGSFMAYYLACETDRFAAIGTVTGSMSTTMYNNCNPINPTPSIHIHGTGDNTNPYIGTSTMTSISDLTMFWVNQNSCNITPTMTAVADINTGDNATAERYLYSGGVNGHTVEHFKVIDGGHSWPGSPMPSSSEVTCMDFDATKELWRFFRQYEKSGVSSVKNHESIKLKMWPNPTDGLVHFETENQNIKEVIILDMQGRVVEKQSQSNIQTVDLNHLQDGSYVIEISGDDFKITEKLIISMTK